MRKKILPAEAAFRLAPLAQQSSASLIALVIDSPPIDGFVPWIAVAVTDERFAEDDMRFDAAPTDSVSGNYLTSNPEADYAIGIFDTGASAHIIDYADADQAGLSGPYLTSNTVELSGVTGSVSAWVSYPLGIFIDGLGVIEPDGLLHDTSGMVGDQSAQPATRPARTRSTDWRAHYATKRTCQRRLSRQSEHGRCQPGHATLPRSAQHPAAQANRHLAVAPGRASRGQVVGFWAWAKFHDKRQAAVIKCPNRLSRHRCQLRRHCWPGKITHRKVVQPFGVYASTISDIIMKLMAKNAEDRYQGAIGLIWDLQACLDGLNTLGRVPVFDIGKKGYSEKILYLSEALRP